jgi:hypothetical protein
MGRSNQVRLGISPARQAGRLPASDHIEADGGGAIDGLRHLSSNLAKRRDFDGGSSRRFKPHGPSVSTVFTPTLRERLEGGSARAA